MALIKAVGNNDTATVTVLLDKGARIDIADKVKALSTSELVCRLCLRVNVRRGEAGR